VESSPYYGYASQRFIFQADHRTDGLLPYTGDLFYIPPWRIPWMLVRGLRLEIDVRKVAMLSRIRLTDDEAAALGPQLSTRLGYVEQYSAVDTDGIKPTAHPHDAALPLRATVVPTRNRRAALHASAPNTESGLYVVPKVID